VSGPTATMRIDWARLDAAIVDLDGTLVDTVGDFELALGLALKDLGLPPVDAAFIRRTVGKGSAHLLAQTLAHLGAPDHLQDGLWAAYQTHYRAVNGSRSPLFEGAEEGLAALRAGGLRLACLTNKPGDFARELLARKGLSACFEAVFGGDAFGRQKPDPLPLIETCKVLGSEPARTLMVGDSRNDAEAARAAGCPVVLATYGYNHGEPVQDVGADALFDRLDRLVWPTDR